MNMAYMGPHLATEIDSLGIVAERGVPVWIEDSHVRAVLRRQGWEYVHDSDDKNDDADNGDDDENTESEGSE